MAIEPLITKLNRNFNTAKESLRTQLLKKLKLDSPFHFGIEGEKLHKALK